MICARPQEALQQGCVGAGWVRAIVPLFSSIRSGDTAAVLAHEGNGHDWVGLQADSSLAGGAKVQKRLGRTSHPAGGPAGAGVPQPISYSRPSYSGRLD